MPGYVTAHVYRTSYGDGPPTPGGIIRTWRVTIVNELTNGAFQPNERQPAILFVPGNVANSVIAVPATFDDGEWVPMPASEALGNPDGGAGPMASGAFVDTGDSRLRPLIEGITGGPFYGGVPLHDHFESWPTYHSMTKD